MGILLWLVEISRLLMVGLAGIVIATSEPLPLSDRLDPAGRLMVGIGISSRMDRREQEGEGRACVADTQVDGATCAGTDLGSNSSSFEPRIPAVFSVEEESAGPAATDSR